MLFRSAILSNGGFNINPTLISKNFENYKKGNRLLKKEVSQNVVNALRKIVNTEEGTAKLEQHNSQLRGNTLTLK